MTPMILNNNRTKCFRQASIKHFDVLLLTLFHFYLAWLKIMHMALLYFTDHFLFMLIYTLEALFQVGESELGSLKDKDKPGAKVIITDKCRS